MRAHPAEIAKEIKDYPFFRNFDESLLLQISTMVQSVDFNQGDVILHAQQMNDKLYFLRNGTVQILVGGERVNELSKPGEVMGEMSVLSGQMVSAQIQAKTNVACYCISASDFVHVNPSQKDRFQFLLYKIYSGVLTDRLMKTNEKAKLYEITARELAQKKHELEIVSAAQMNFMRNEVAPSANSVMLVEPNKKQQNIIKSALGGAGVQLFIADSIEEAQNGFQIQRPDVIFCDDSTSDFLKWVHTQNYQGQCVLLESTNVDFQKLLNYSFVQNVISRNPEDRAGTVKAILTSLSKILHNNYFGIEKYLAWGTVIRSIKVNHSKQRGSVKEEMITHFRSQGIRGSLLDRVQMAAEEILMNAIYDAPVDSQGKVLFNHLPRTTEVSLDPSQEAEFRFGCDGNILAVSIQDPFGTLRRETIIAYLDSCYKGNAGYMNAEKGGAGRGLHQILESSDWTVFNVKAANRTEVICLFDIDQKRDGPPQFHYFFVK